MMQVYRSIQLQTALPDKLAPKVKIPFMNDEIGFIVSTEMMPNPQGPQAKNHAELSVCLFEIINGCTVRPEFIGCHMCGIINTWRTMPSKEKAQHQGLMSVNEEFNPIL